jgi:hypothetical protein
MASSRMRRSEHAVIAAKTRWIPGVWFSCGSGSGVSPVCRLELVPKDSLPTLSSIFVEILCRSSVENGLFRQSFPTKDSDKDSATRPLGQARVVGTSRCDVRAACSGATLSSARRRKERPGRPVLRSATEGGSRSLFQAHHYGLVVSVAPASTGTWRWPIALWPRSLVRSTRTR